jgi:predicted CXXCH cytochrome family protein
MRPTIIILCIFLSLLLIGNYFDYQNVSYAYDEASSTGSLLTDETDENISSSTMINLEGKTSVLSSDIEIFEVNASNPTEPILTITTSEDGSWTFSRSFEVGIHDFKFIGSGISATISIMVDFEKEQYISNIVLDPDSEDINFHLSSLNIPINRSNSCSSCHNLHEAEVPKLLNTNASSSIAECVWKLLNTTTSP